MRKTVHDALRRPLSLAVGAAVGFIPVAVSDRSVEAITPYFHPPIRPEIATISAQPQLKQGVCHDQGYCTQNPPVGSDAHNYWSVDLFDSTWQSQNGAPVLRRQL